MKPTTAARAEAKPNSEIRSSSVREMEKFPRSWFGRDLDHLESCWEVAGMIVDLMKVVCSLGFNSGSICFQLKEVLTAPTQIRLICP